MSTEHPEPTGALARSLAALAETPDDDPEVEIRLALLVRQAVDRVGAADYASVTGLREGAYTSVAVSSELIRAVDDVQQSIQDGPCVEAMRRQRPTGIPDLGRTVRWPGFAREALRLGLLASVSVPLFTASGVASAVLNLYGRDQIAMAPLIAGVWQTFDPDAALPVPAGLAPVDDGGRELLSGFAAAVAVRATIQKALYVLMERHDEAMRQAYARLTALAVGSTLSLRAVAVLLLEGDA